MTCCPTPLPIIGDAGNRRCRNCNRTWVRPCADLSDEALAAALELARLRRSIDGRLGVRVALAELEAESARRDEIAELEAVWMS